MNQKLKTTATATLAVAFLFGVGGLFQANARPAFARKEKKKCIYCHLGEHGGPRGFRGMYYGEHNHTFKGFVEKKEAKLAGVKAGSMGEATKPTKPYGKKDKEEGEEHEDKGGK